VSDVARRIVWVGLRAADQTEYDARAPDMLDVPGRRFLDLTLTGPIEFSRANNRRDAARVLGRNALEGIDWVLVGGESRRQALDRGGWPRWPRPCDLAWIESVVRQCRACGVPVYVKRIGAQPWRMYPGHVMDGDPCACGACDGGQERLQPHRHGVDPVEWPETLRVRELPKTMTE